VRAGIQAHGFSVSDISIYLLLTVSTLTTAVVWLRSKGSPKANVYINPVGKIFMTDPYSVNWKERTSAAMLANLEIGNLTPVSRIRYLKDGDAFDLGTVKTENNFTPAHQRAAW